MNIKYCDANNDYIFSLNGVEIYFDSICCEGNLIFFKRSGESVGSLIGDGASRFLSRAKEIGVPEIK